MPHPSIEALGWRRMTPWGAFVAEVLRRTDCSLRRAAGRLGVAPSELSRAMRGLATFPLKHAEPFAEVLGLRGSERERFLLLCELNRATPRIQRYVLELEGQLDDEGVRRAADASREAVYRAE